MIDKFVHPYNPRNCQCKYKKHQPLSQTIMQIFVNNFFKIRNCMWFWFTYMSHTDCLQRIRIILTTIFFTIFIRIFSLISRFANNDKMQLLRQLNEETMQVGPLITKYTPMVHWSNIHNCIFQSWRSTYSYKIPHTLMNDGFNEMQKIIQIQLQHTYSLLFKHNTMLISQCS